MIMSENYTIDDLLKSPFEKIKRISEEGYEFWFARDLSNLLEYSQYRHFLPVIEKAKEALENLDENIDNHMEDILNMVEIGSGAKREIDDIKLSRFACYLILFQDNVVHNLKIITKYFCLVFLDHKLKLLNPNLQKLIKPHQSN